MSTHFCPLPPSPAADRPGPGAGLVARPPVLRRPGVRGGGLPAAAADLRGPGCHLATAPEPCPAALQGERVSPGLAVSWRGHPADALALLAGLLQWAPRDKPHCCPQVPGVPLLPALSIVMNVCLMLQMSPATWTRLAVWMLVGEWGAEDGTGDHRTPWAAPWGVTGCLLTASPPCQGSLCILDMASGTAWRSRSRNRSSNRSSNRSRSRSRSPSLHLWHRGRHLWHPGACPKKPSAELTGHQLGMPTYIPLLGREQLHDSASIKAFNG